MNISSANLANRLTHPDHMEPRQKKSYFLSFFFFFECKTLLQPLLCTLLSVSVVDLDLHLYEMR